MNTCPYWILKHKDYHLYTVRKDSCLLYCRSVESPPGASRQGEAPAGPSPATPTRRPGRPVTQPLSRLSHHMDWQPCCSSRTLAISKHSTGLLSQLTITGDSGLFKGYNYVSNLIFMFDWSGLHRVLRMTHLEAAPTMRITGC